MMRAAPVLVAALAAFAAPAQAQEKARFKPEYVEGSWKDGEYLAYCRGVEITPFKIEDKEMWFRADRAILWTSGPDDAAGGLLAGVRRFYAEGNVLFFRRDVLSRKVEVFRAEQFYLDLETRAGYFYDVRIDQRSGDASLPSVTLRASEARLAAGGLDVATENARAAGLGLPGLGTLPPGRMVVFDVVISTCTFGDPHYHLGLAEAQVDWKWSPGGNPLRFFQGKPEDPSVGGNWVTLNIWGLPVFAWPSFYLKLAALSALPLERVQGGRTSRFGTSIESTWGLKVSKGLVDWINPFDDGAPKDDEETWGRLRWEIDYRQVRGWAAGIDPSWKWENYSGYLDTYYLRDKGPDPDNDFDARFLPLEREDRGRARLFHRVDFSDRLRGEVEVSWLSDRNVLEEFFEKEFKEGKEQETVAYLRYLDGNVGGFLMARTRINDFQTQVEFLPKAKGFLADEPILPGLPFGWSFREELEIANLRQKFDDALTLPVVETWRFDSLSSWTLSVPLGVATLSPFADARVTAWEEALDGDPADRFIATAGARLAMDIHGVHDVESDFLGLHGLRHIIHLEGRAVTAFANTLEPAELFPYDAVDGYDKFTEYSFEFRNRFQTKVIDGQEFRTKDFLELGAEIEFYPDAPRDTVGFKASNFSYPFNWITLGPHDAAKVLDERDWSNIHWDVLFRPTNYFEARGVGQYNPVHKQEEAREFGVTVRPREGLALSVGQVFVFDVTNAFTIGAKWDLTEKWRVTAEGQFDFKTNDFINRKAAVGRDFHDFRFDLVFEEDAGRDERRYYVTFVPTFLRIPR
jgi:hypothetical protein